MRCVAIRLEGSNKEAALFAEQFGLDIRTSGIAVRMTFMPWRVWLPALVALV
jgi:hypothetical protein